MAKYRSRPVEIEATQWHKPGDHEMVLTIGGASMVRGMQGMSEVHPGDWIIEEPDGKSGYYPCNPEVFAKKYEPVVVTQGGAD